MTTRAWSRALVLAGWGIAAAACGPYNRIHATFGDTYRSTFAAQTAEHNHRPVAALNGDEARRAMQTYYLQLSPEGGREAGGQQPGGAGGASGVVLPSLQTGGAGGAGGSPFNFKVR